MATYLVTLATGQQGRYTIKHLLAAGAKVHAVVRDPTSSAARQLEKDGAGNVTLFKGGLKDLDVWREAAQNTTGIFLNLPDTDVQEGEDSAGSIATNLLRVAREAGVQNVVTSTALLVDQPESWDNDFAVSIGLKNYFASKVQIEAATKSAGFDHWTILRPGWINSNYLLPTSKYAYPELSSTGQLRHVLAPGKTMVHTDEEDVGKFAAAALLDPVNFGEQDIELGAEDLTMEQVAEHLSRSAGKHIMSERRSEEEISKVMASEDIPVSLPFEQWASKIEFKAARATNAETFGIPLSTFEAYLQKRQGEVRASFI